jgi:hypothetical protein
VRVRVRADAPHRFVEHDLVVDPGVLAAGAQLGERVQVNSCSTRRSGSSLTAGGRRRSRTAS